MTRNDILEAAAQIFSEKGYHAASMQDIASLVNLQKASLYHHVSSKQEILLALLDRALDLLIAQIEPVVRSDLAPHEKLRRAMQVYLLSLVENRELAAVLLLEYRSLEPGMQVRHIPRRDRFEGLWRSLIQEGIQQEVFCCVDPAMAARALLGQMNWAITWFRTSGSLTAADIAEQFAGLMLYGLLTRAVD